MWTGQGWFYYATKPTLTNFNKQRDIFKKLCFVAGDELNGQLTEWLSKAKDEQKPARAIIAP
jgi:hypothetical protein